MIIRFRSVLPLAMLAIIAGCSAPQERRTQPPPRPIVVPPASVPAPTPSQGPQGDWIDWPIAAGDWVYRQDARGSIALFGAPGADALVTLRCDRQRGRVYMARQSAQPAAGLTIRTSAQFKNYQAVTTAGSPPYVAVEMMPNDGILDALAYSRGRFALQVSGEQSVAIPVWSEIGRIVDDCR